MEIKLIGNKIAKARKEKNMSQAELAEQLFISPQAVGKWERGESIPDLITFNRLAKILDVDLNYFSEDFNAGSEVAFKIDTPAEVNLKKKSNWDMSKGNWVDADFSGLKNLHEKFSSSNMQRTKFIGSDMSGILLKNNHVDTCDFSKSEIKHSHFVNSHLVNNLFISCSLVETEFTESHIKSCNFSEADLSGTKFNSCAVQKSTFTNAALNSTSFKESHISDTVFEGKMEDCHFENCAFSKVIFNNLTITNTFFKGRSLKQIKFIDCKADRITYEFLKNGKADVSGITLIA